MRQMLRPAWPIALATSSTSLVAHRLGGGALPHGGQWALPLLAVVAVWALARPVKLTTSSVGMLLVVGQLLSHVCLELAVPHEMGGALVTHGSSSTPSPDGMGVMVSFGHGHLPEMPAAGASWMMLAAHLVGTACAWTFAHLLLRATAEAVARWDALTGRIPLPRIVIRRRRAAVCCEHLSVAEAGWRATAPLRGPPRAASAAH